MKLSTNDDFALARVLGQREAFGFTAARCSAAEALLMLSIREQKAYLSRCPTWAEFCETYLHMSKAQANRIIHMLKEFGAPYFDLQQLTHITSDGYRAIQPYIEDNQLHFDDEEVDLLPENAVRVAAMVKKIRAELPPSPAPDPVVAVERRIDGMLKLLVAVTAAGGDRVRLAAAVNDLRLKLEDLERQLA